MAAQKLRREAKRREKRKEEEEVRERLAEKVKVEQQQERQQSFEVEAVKSRGFLAEEEFDEDEDGSNHLGSQNVSDEIN